MRVIQVARSSWLVIDDAFRARFVIVYAAAVNRATHETHMMYRVDKWALDRENRIPQRWVDTYRGAVEHCVAVLETPSFDAPMRGEDGTVVPADLQRQRWAQGLDPRSGRPRAG